MDGRKPLLRSLFIASLALTSHTPASQADEFTRQPSRTQQAPMLPNSTALGRQTAPAPQLLFSGPVVIDVPATKPIRLPAPEQLNNDSNRLKFARPIPNTAFALRPSKSPNITEPKSQRGRPAVLVSDSKQARDEHQIIAAQTQSLPQSPNSSKSSHAIVTAIASPKKSEITSVRAEPNTNVKSTRAATQPTAKAAHDTQVSSEHAKRDEQQVASQPSHPPHTEPAVTEIAVQEVAAKTAQLPTNRPGDPNSASQRSSPSALEPGPGWQAVGEQLKNHLTKCEELISRKAYLSAMAESHQAIIHLVRVLDLRQNKLSCEPAWTQAQQALREAQEFTSFEQIANDQQLFASLIQGHETPALRDAIVTELTPLAAAQHYRAFAEQSLVKASLGHPWFSELYYCLGRSLQAQAEGGHPQSEALLQEALTYYRAANSIQPTNANNANQLCFVLLRMDRPAEAFALLGEVVRLPDCPLEAWQNLAEASLRLGDTRAEKWALQNYVALKSQGVRPSGPTGTLVEVDPKQFAAMSPRTSGPQALAPVSTVSNATSVSSSSAPVGVAPTSAAVAPNRTASTPRFGFFR